MKVPHNRMIRREEVDNRSLDIVMFDRKRYHVREYISGYDTDMYIVLSSEDHQMVVNSIQIIDNPLFTITETEQMTSPFISEEFRKYMKIQVIRNNRNILMFYERYPKFDHRYINMMETILMQEYGIVEYFPISIYDMVNKVELKDAMGWMDQKINDICEIAFSNDAILVNMQSLPIITLNDHPQIYETIIRIFIESLPDNVFIVSYATNIEWPLLEDISLSLRQKIEVIDI